MDVKACDRCGEIYPINVDIFYDYTVIKNQTRIMDLCVNCIRELDTFMHKDQKETNRQECYDPVTGHIVVCHRR